MLFLENSSSLHVNVDLMPQRYGQVYTRHAQSITDVLVVPVSPNIDTISGENADISSLSVDIDSQSDLDIPIALYIHYITFCLMHIFQHNIMFLFPPLILIIFPSLFHMPCQIQVGGQQ